MSSFGTKRVKINQVGARLPLNATPKVSPKRVHSILELPCEYSWFHETHFNSEAHKARGIAESQLFFDVISMSFNRGFRDAEG